MRLDARKDLEETLRDMDSAQLGMAVSSGLLALRLPAVRRQPDLAEQTAWELRNELPHSHRLIELSVRGGWVTLAGQVEWNYQKNGAEAAACRGWGVKGVSNEVRVQPRIDLAEVSRQVEEALREGAAAAGGGTVRSWAEREQPQVAGDT